MVDISLEEIVVFLDALLVSEEPLPEDQQGIYHPSALPIKRIGLALEPWVDIHAWVRREDLQVLFLHRPWRLRIQDLPAGVGVISYHLAFDLALTIGFNPRLATALNMHNFRPCSMQEGRYLGMIGDIPALSSEQCLRSLEDIFGVRPDAFGILPPFLERIAVVGALNPSLVQEAVSLQAQAYITGQWRPAAQKALQSCGLPVLTVGHTAAEQWGLRVLAHLLQERWHCLSVVLAPDASRL